VPVDNILAELQQITKNDVKEIVITSIEISSWGRDLPNNPPLWHLIEILCQTYPNIRFRLGSLEPRIIDANFISMAIRSSNLCKHFHIPLQSGCDKTLAAMNRRYSTADYAGSLAALRNAIPDVAVTTDLIVGFPGETETDFLQSHDFFKSCHFSDAHIFPYSKRNDTAAAIMTDQISTAIKKERAAEAARSSKSMTETYARSWIQRDVEVLVEANNKGYSQHYLPVTLIDGNYNKNTLVTAKITDYQDGTLIGCSVNGT